MERKVPNRWTEEEDGILQNETQKQAAKGTIKDWNKIAAKLPGRTNKDCRKRWVNKVCGSLKKGMWDYAEDQRLLGAVAKHGQKWTLVANEVAFRSPDQCAKRWQSKLDPNLKHSSWTADEDTLLIRLVNENGRGWKMMQEHYFPDRSANELKNRHTVLSRQAKSPYARSGSLDACSVAGTEDTTYSNDVYNGADEADGLDYDEEYLNYWGHRGSWSSGGGGGMVDNSSSLCTTPYSPILPHDVSASAPLNEYITSAHLAAMGMGGSDLASQPAAYDDMVIAAAYHASETPLSSTSASDWSSYQMGGGGGGGGGAQGYNATTMQQQQQHNTAAEDQGYNNIKSSPADHPSSSSDLYWGAGDRHCGGELEQLSSGGSEPQEDEPVGKVSLMIDGCDRDTLHHLIELTRTLKGKSKIEINSHAIQRRE